MDLKSEFAQVRVELDTTANGPRLMIRDMRTGMTNYFDPLELESLAWARHEDLAPLLDPSRETDAHVPAGPVDDAGVDKLLRELRGGTSR